MAVFSAAAQIFSGNKAADAQKDAAAESTQLQREQYEQSRKDYAPFRQAGLNATAAIQSELGLSGTPYFSPNGLNAFDPETGDIDGVRYAGEPNYGATPAEPAPTTGGTVGGNVQFVGGQNRFIPEGFEWVEARGEEGLSGLVSPNRLAPFTGQTTAATSGQQGQQGGQTNALATTPGDPGTPGIKFGGYEQSKGYQHQQEEGMRSLNNSLASMGLSGSGAAIKQGIRFNQGLLNQDYGQWFNRLQSQAGQGQTATNSLASLGSTFAANAGNNALASGAAQAQNYNNIGNAITGGISNLTSAAGFFL